MAASSHALGAQQTVPDAHGRSCSRYRSMLSMLCTRACRRRHPGPVTAPVSGSSRMRGWPRRASRSRSTRSTWRAARCWIRCRVTSVYTRKHSGRWCQPVQHTTLNGGPPRWVLRLQRLDTHHSTRADRSLPRAVTLSELTLPYEVGITRDSHCSSWREVKKQNKDHWQHGQHAAS